MNKKLEALRKKATEPHTYSDVDGDNNRGTRLNEEKFARLIIEKYTQLIIDTFPGHRVTDVDFDLIQEQLGV